MTWITRDDALARLGVKPQTLYAYVSRGVITSRPMDADPRTSLYFLPDIDAFLKRRRTGRARSAIAQATISWGDPVMETSITTVRDGRLIYRGQDAVELAASATLEDTAGLLWQSNVAAGGRRMAAPETDTTGKTGLLAWLAACAASHDPGFGRGADALAGEAAGLLAGACDAISGRADNRPFHERLARAWGLDKAGTDIIRRALVLVADHELNPSTFAARIAASTGSSLAACALAGCATLTGPLHGEASARALAYLKTSLAGSPATALAGIASRGERIPAVGHPLYPAGDPRAAALLGWMKPDDALQDAVSVAEDASGKAANVDMALAALTLHLGLAEDAPFLVFACGRMAGWLAHAQEQLTSGRLIRPRATYTGKGR